MAKRQTGVGKHMPPGSHKTAKRLEAKRQMLLAKNAKNRKHNRHISVGKLRPRN